MIVFEKSINSKMVLSWDWENEITNVDDFDSKKLLSIPFIFFYVRKPEDWRTAFILYIIPILITSFFY